MFRTRNIPFCRPSISWRERIAVDDVLASGQLGQGSLVQEFEQAFAKYTGARFAVAVASGSDALFLSLAALGIGPGHTVAVPSLTFTASASMIAHRGARIEFVDVNRDNLCIDWEKVALLREGHKLDAVIAVDLTGNDSVGDIHPGVPLIIDSAHHISRGCHKFGQLRTYSFHPTKNMTTGFGGMITTDDEDHAKYLRLARMHGCYKRGWDTGELSNDSKRYGYEVKFLGWKMNMNNIEAALGLVQLERLDSLNAKRTRAVEFYNSLFGFQSPRHGNHLYPVFVEHRDDFLKFMAQAGIECSIHFEPLHLMEAYKDAWANSSSRLPVTEMLGACMVSLPLFPGLKNGEIKYIVKTALDSGLLLHV